jgi:hypothetical protein
MNEECCLISKCIHNKDGECCYLNSNNGSCIGLSCEYWVSWDDNVKNLINSLLPKENQIGIDEHVDILHLNKAIANYNKME